MPDKEERLSRMIDALPFFEGIEDKEKNCLTSGIPVKKYAKHKPLFYQGDSADRLFLVIDGWVKLYRNTEEGDEYVMAVFTCGDVFGEASLFPDAGYPFAAVAIEDATVLEIPATRIRECAAENPEIMARVLQAMAREMHKLQMENEHIVLMSAPERVGCLLLQLAEDSTGKGRTFSFPYEKALAAQRLGMKPETFSRALAQLKPLGVSVHGPEIRIENFDDLTRYACRHCSAESKECPGAIRKRAISGTGTGACS